MHCPWKQDAQAAPETPLRRPLHNLRIQMISRQDFDRTNYRIYVYKRDHPGDPSPEGEFGANDCMGDCRAKEFDAVIGFGGKGRSAVSNELQGKIGWVGVGIQSRIMIRNHRGPVIRFEHFINYGTDGTQVPNEIVETVGLGRRGKVLTVGKTGYDEAKLILRSCILDPHSAVAELWEPLSYDPTLLPDIDHGINLTTRTLELSDLHNAAKDFDLDFDDIDHMYQTLLRVSSGNDYVDYDVPGIENFALRFRLASILFKRRFTMQTRHRCHIRARNNGGSDHPDNIIIWSDKYNLLTSDREDHFAAFFAGLDQTIRALQVSLNHKRYAAVVARAKILCVSARLQLVRNFRAAGLNFPVRRGQYYVKIINGRFHYLNGPPTDGLGIFVSREAIAVLNTIDENNLTGTLLDKIFVELTKDSEWKNLYEDRAALFDGQEPTLTEFIISHLYGTKETESSLPSNKNAARQARYLCKTGRYLMQIALGRTPAIEGDCN